MDRKSGALMSISMFSSFMQGVRSIQRTQNSIKKSARVLRLPVTISFSLFLLTSLVPPWGTCAELRPYELPSQKRVPYQQRYDAPAQIPESAPFDYEGFRAKAANLPSRERTKLKQGLQHRLERASKANNNSEVVHYAKLLEIINNIR